MLMVTFKKKISYEKNVLWGNSDSAGNCPLAPIKKNNKKLYLVLFAEFPSKSGYVFVMISSFKNK